MNALELLDRLVAFQTIRADSNLLLIDFVRGYLTRRGVECRANILKNRNCGVVTPCWID